MSLLFDGCHRGQQVDAGGGGGTGPWQCLVIRPVFPGNRLFQDSQFEGENRNRHSLGASSIICQAAWLLSRLKGWDASVNQHGYI